MLRCTFYQVSLLGVDPDEIRLEKDSFERALPDLLPRLVSLDDFRDFHPSTMGAGTCGPLVLTSMLLLQFRYNLTDEALVARCIRDLGFRYALGLPRGKHSQASLFRKSQGDPEKPVRTVVDADPGTEAPERRDSRVDDADLLAQQLRRV